MRRIEDEAARMGLLVEDLLLLARLDQQRPLERETVDLLTLAADAVHDAAAVAPDRRSRSRSIDGAAAVEIVGDEARLRQVVGNLVTNALTHTPPARRSTVRVGSRADADELLGVLEVRDQGPGLDEEASRQGLRAVLPGGRRRAPEASAARVSACRSSPRWSPPTAAGSSVDTAPGEGATFRVLLPALAVETPATVS